MVGGLRIRLSDGSMLELAEDELPAVVDELWRLQASPGAVSALGVIEHERRRTPIARADLEFSKRDSAVLVEAVDLARDLAT
jgi:hypothetical protein